MVHAATSTRRGRDGGLHPWRVPAGLWVAALLGLAIRLYVVLIARPTCEPYDEAAEGCKAIGGDAIYFFLQARLLADGQWFVDPVQQVGEPQAGDPPLFASFLALFHLVGIDTPQGQRIVTSVLGAVGVVLIGLLAGRLAGPRAAVVAGVLAALYPMLWINDGQLMSESLYIPLIAVLLLLAYGLHESPTVGRALGLGAVVGLAALTRGEALLFFPFLVLPLVLGFRRLPVARRLALGGMAAVAGALVLLPWFAYNMVRFEEPTTMSSSPGSVLLSSACDRAYDGATVGYYAFECLALPVSELPPVPPDADKSVQDARIREAAQDYIAEHAGELPRVAAFRVGRVWEVYRPMQNVELNAVAEGRGELASRLGLYGYFALLPLALAGGVVLWRWHRLPVSPFVGLAVTATVVAALSFGVTRYRVPVDVALVVLAAVALDAAWARWGPGAPPAEQTDERGAEDPGAEDGTGVEERVLADAPA